MNPVQTAAQKYAMGRCRRNNLGPKLTSSFVQGTIATFLAGAAWQRERDADIEREAKPTAVAACSEDEKK